MREIVPGLHHWSTRHPNIGQRVSSYYLVASRALLDPMVPEEGVEAIESLGAPEHVVLSCRHHDRDHAEFVERFGCAFHVPANGVHEYEGEQVVPYDLGNEPAPDIRAIANGPIAPDDTILHLDVGGGALLFADSLINMGGLAYMPDYLLGDDPEKIRNSITEALRALLDEQFEHMLFAHGDPIINNGKRALEQFLAPSD